MLPMASSSRSGSMSDTPAFTVTPSPGAYPPHAAAIAGGVGGDLDAEVHPAVGLGGEHDLGLVLHPEILPSHRRPLTLLVEASGAGLGVLLSPDPLSSPGARPAQL